MLSVLFSNLPKGVPTDKYDYYWGIISETKKVLGYDTSYIRDGNFEESLVGKDVLVVFPGLADDERAVKHACALGIPIVQVYGPHGKALGALGGALWQIEQKKIP
jgi:hypothetical protein